MSTRFPHSASTSRRTMNYAERMVVCHENNIMPVDAVTNTCIVWWLGSRAYTTLELTNHHEPWTIFHASHPPYLLIKDIPRYVLSKRPWILSFSGDEGGG